MNWVRGELAFLLILLAAGLVRVELARTASYIHDEENTSIPLSQQISFAAGSRYLPLRAVNHPALPAYFVKAGSSLVGPTRFGYRAAHVVTGLLAVWLVYLLARQAYGAWAGRWAAALLAFNEYFLTISSRATAHGPYLLFVTATLYAFSRGLVTGRGSVLLRGGRGGWPGVLLQRARGAPLAGALPDLAAAALPALAATAAPVRGVRGVRAPDRTGRAVESAGEPRRGPRHLRQPRSGPGHLREPPEAHRRDRPLAVPAHVLRARAGQRRVREGHGRTVGRQHAGVSVDERGDRRAAAGIGPRHDGTPGGVGSAAWVSPAGVLVHVRLLHADSPRRFAGARPRELDLGGRHDGAGVGGGGSAPGRCRGRGGRPLGGGWPGRGVRGVSVLYPPDALAICSYWPPTFL